jgi:hypothetical protein
MIRRRQSSCLMIMTCRCTEILTSPVHIEVKRSARPRRMTLDGGEVQYCAVFRYTWGPPSPPPFLSFLAVWIGRMPASCMYPGLLSFGTREKNGTQVAKSGGGCGDHPLARLPISRKKSNQSGWRKRMTKEHCSWWNHSGSIVVFA